MIHICLNITKRIATLFLTVALLWPVSVYAYFTEVISNEASISAGHVTITVGLTESSTILGPAKPSFTSSLGITNEATIDNQLFFTTSTIGDSSFCGQVSVDAGALGLAGPVESTTAGPFSPTSGLEVYDFELTLDIGDIGTIAHGVGCDVSITINSTQKDFSTLDIGFHDAEALTWNLSASTIVLNEVLADPATGQKEFVELYNNGSTPVDVAGWTIGELSGSSEVLRTIVSGSGTAGDLEAYDGSGTTLVPAGGHLALSFVGSASYLNNDGDTVTLRDASAIILDSYTYTSSLDGKSDARIPDGIGNWIDPIPTPGGANRLESILTSLSIELASTSASSSDTDKTETEQETTFAGNSGGGNPVDEAPKPDIATTSSSTASSTVSEPAVETGTTTTPVASSTEVQESTEVVEEIASSSDEVSKTVVEKDEDSEEPPTDELDEEDAKTPKPVETVETEPVTEPELDTEVDEEEVIKETEETEPEVATEEAKPTEPVEAVEEVTEPETI